LLKRYIQINMTAFKYGMAQRDRLNNGQFQGQTVPARQPRAAPL
jgi:hypothetical protein